MQNEIWNLSNLYITLAFLKILVRNVLVARLKTPNQSCLGIKYDLMVTLMRKSVIVADLRCGQIQGL